MPGMSTWIQQNLVKEIPIVGKAFYSKKDTPQRVGVAIKCTFSILGGMGSMYVFSDQDAAVALKDALMMSAVMMVGMTLGKIAYNVGFTAAYNCYTVMQRARGFAAIEPQEHASLRPLPPL